MENKKIEKGRLYIPLNGKTIHYKGRKVTPVWRVTVVLRSHVFAREAYGNNDAVISFDDLENKYESIEASDLYSERELTLMTKKELANLKELFGDDALKSMPPIKEARLAINTLRALEKGIPEKKSFRQKFLQYLKSAF